MMTDGFTDGIIVAGTCLYPCLRTLRLPPRDPRTIYALLRHNAPAIESLVDAPSPRLL